MPLINNKIYSYDAKGFKRYKEEKIECTGRPTGQGYGAARKGLLLRQVQLLLTIRNMIILFSYV